MFHFYIIAYFAFAEVEQGRVFHTLAGRFPQVFHSIYRSVGGEDPGVGGRAVTGGIDEDVGLGGEDGADSFR